MTSLQDLIAALERAVGDPHSGLLEPIFLFVLETIAPERNRGHSISLLYSCPLLTPPDESRRAGATPSPAAAWSWHASMPADLLPVQRPYAEFF